MRKLLVGSVAVLALAGCGVGATKAAVVVTTAPTTTAVPKGMLLGTLTLVDPSGYTPLGTVCYGKNGYNDIKAGTNVTVKNQTGDIIGADQLRDGMPRADGCVFPFVVDVADAKFYSVEVGHRGALVYSKAQLDADGWMIPLTLGTN